MLQVRVHGPGDVRVDDLAEPDPGPRDAVVRVSACGICGIDLSYIAMGGLAGPTGEPMCLGHEMAATVECVVTTSRRRAWVIASSCIPATTRSAASATARRKGG